MGRFPRACYEAPVPRTLSRARSDRRPNPPGETGWKAWMDVIEALEVGPAWAGHPVGFALLTSGERQYVAFYDEDRALRVASRELSSRSWHFTRLPVTTNWDSHRYITMAMDRGGHLHLAGNMHNSPLVYFRMSRPHDAESLRGIHGMVGHDEERCTYPRFFRGPDD